MKTLAQQDVERRQREYPPTTGTDRAAALFQAICPLQDQKLEAKRKAGKLVVAESGLPSINAKTFHLPDGNHSIFLFSGLIDFYRNVAAILNGGTNEYVRDRIVANAKPPETMQEQLTRLFREAFQQPATAPVPVADDALGFVGGLLAKASLSLVLCHELGHVLYYKPSPGQAAGRALTLRQEYQSDSSALQQLNLASTELGDRRIFLAGAFIALRVLAVFGEMGFAFPPGHPPPLDRLQALSATARTLWPSERVYWSTTPIAYAYDEMLEDAGLMAMGTGRRTAVTVDRAFSRMSAALEAAVNKQIPDDQLVQTINLDLVEATPDVLEGIAAIAARMFPNPPIGTGDLKQDDLWARKADRLRSLSSRWVARPEPLFNQVFHPASTTV